MGGEQVLRQRPTLEQTDRRVLGEGRELGHELRPGEIEQPLQPILEPRGFDRQAMPIAHQDAQLGVGRLKKREADKGAVAHELTDHAGVFDVGLQRAVVLKLFRALGVCRQHIDDRVAAAREEMREGEAMVTSELQADEHLDSLNVRKQGLELRVRTLKALATHQYLDRFAAKSIRPTRHQDVEALAGIDANVDGKGAGEGGFLIRGHGAALQGGSRRSDYVLAGRVNRE